MLAAQTKNKNFNEFVFLSFIFLILRLISSFSIFQFLQSFDDRIFSYTDLDFYNRADLNIFSPNFVYAFFVKQIGYNNDNLFSFKFISISFLLSFIVVTPFIFLGQRFFSKKNSLIFIVILSLHPYLSLYSLKIDSSIFATLGISFYSLWIFYSKNITLNLSIILNVFSALFRNSLIPLIWLQFFLIFFIRRNYKGLKFLTIFSLFLITLFITSSQFFYGIEYLSQNFGCYSYTNIYKFFQVDLNPNLSKILSILLTPIIHLILDLGAREAISVYCLNLPTEYASSQILNFLMTFAFLFFHLFLLIKLLFFVFKDFNLRKLTLLFPFSILLPTLYGTAHMRYLYPLIPLLIFVQFLPKNFQTLKKI